MLVLVIFYSVQNQMELIVKKITVMKIVNNGIILKLGIMTANTLLVISLIILTAQIEWTKGKLCLINHQFQ